MPTTKAPAKAKTQTQIEAPMVKPPSRMERNLPRPPETLRVCGNTIKVKDGKAAEADPKVIRRRRKEALRRRGDRDGKTYREDETRI